MPPLIPVDKANHAIYGALAYIVAAALAVVLGWTEHRFVAGFAGSLVVGVWKEINDYRANREAIADGFTPLHTADPRDLLATICGGIVAALAATVGAA